jgi:hypothetical protein
MTLGRAETVRVKALYLFEILLSIVTQGKNFPIIRIICTSENYHELPKGLIFLWLCTAAIISHVVSRKSGFEGRGRANIR